MMHTKITPQPASDKACILLRVLIERIDELVTGIQNASSLMHMLSRDDDLSRTQASAIRALEALNDTFANEAEAISEKLAAVVPGAERWPG
jgi:hypothetical protein